MKRAISQAALLLSAAVFTASCAPADTTADEGTAETGETTVTAVSDQDTVEIEDNEGVKSVPHVPERVAALDDRARELLEALGVNVSDTDSRVDLVVAATAESAAGPRTEAAFVDLSPRDGIPLDWEMVRQAQVLGTILGREEEAAELDDQFSQARGRAIDARNESWTFAALSSNGNELTVQPTEGDGLWRPVFDMLELTPALAPDGSVDLRALIDAKPRFLLVTERPKAFGEDGYESPMRLMTEHTDLAQLPAVEKGNVYVAPLEVQDTASLVAYTKIFNELADQWSEMP